MASALEVMRFFGFTAGEFRTQWSGLDSASKAQLRSGVGDKSLTY